jgi:hypothetical protein
MSSYDTAYELDRLDEIELLDTPEWTESWETDEESALLSAADLDPFWHVVYTPRVNGVHTDSLSVRGIRAAAALQVELTEAGLHVAFNTDNGYARANFLCQLEQECMNDELRLLAR